MTGPVRGLRLGVAGALVALIAGCGSTDRNVARVDDAVSTVTVGEPADVAAPDLARAMLAAGFSPGEVLTYGPGVRNSLAQSGGAQVQSGNAVAAVFSIMDGKLYVSSQLRGTTVHDLSGFS